MPTFPENSLEYNLFPIKKVGARLLQLHQAIQANVAANPAMAMLREASERERQERNLQEWMVSLPVPGRSLEEREALPGSQEPAQPTHPPVPMDRPSGGRPKNPPLSFEQLIALGKRAVAENCEEAERSGLRTVPQVSHDQIVRLAREAGLKTNASYVSRDIAKLRESGLPWPPQP